jgi:hypothetical protein
MKKPSLKALALDSSSVKIFEKMNEKDKLEKEISINSNSLEEFDFKRNMDSEVNS